MENLKNFRQISLSLIYYLNSYLFTFSVNFSPTSILVLLTQQNTDHEGYVLTPLFLFATQIGEDPECSFNLAISLFSLHTGQPITDLARIPLSNLDGAFLDVHT